MKKLNMHIVAVLLAVLLALLPVSAAYAVDTDYTGPLDPETNQPASGSSAESSSRIILTSTMYYDTRTRDYVFPVDGSLTEVHANVADGMVRNDAVSVSNGGDPSVRVYCNGQEVTGDTSNLREVGDYMVSAAKGGTTERIITFMIVGETTNALHTFTVPDGFYIISATRDGRDVFDGRYELNMEEEGRYKIEYECGATDRIYTLQTTIDRTPPELRFSGKIDSKKRVHSALSFSGLQSTDTIVLYRDAVQVAVKTASDGTGTITDSGNYVMRVYDAAGNVHEYTFQIMVYLNAGAWLLVLLVIAVIVAVGLYIFLKRKNLKIG